MPFPEILPDGNIRLKGFIHYQLERDWSKPDAPEVPNYAIWSHMMTTAGYVFLKEVEIVTEPVGMTKAVVDTVELLRKEQQRLRAEAESESRKIEDRINDLLMLTYDPTSPSKEVP